MEGFLLYFKHPNEIEAKTKRNTTSKELEVFYPFIRYTISFLSRYFCRHDISHQFLGRVLFCGSWFSPILVFFGAYCTIVLFNLFCLGKSFLNCRVLSILIEFYKLRILKICLLLSTYFKFHRHRPNNINKSFVFTGHVGAPLPCNLVKLVDIPEKECYSKDGRGEVSMVFNRDN